MQALQQRWSAILGLPAAGEQRRVQLRSADLAGPRWPQAFPVRPRVWPMAVHHSPDLMIAGGDADRGGRYTWVLGEVHPSIVTTRYASWLAFHPDPDGLRAGLRHDLAARTCVLAETARGGRHLLPGCPTCWPRPVICGWSSPATPAAMTRR